VLSIDHTLVTGKDVKDPGWYIQMFDDVWTSCFLGKFSNLVGLSVGECHGRFKRNLVYACCFVTNYDWT
jgi:hypothetical protein